MIMKQLFRHTFDLLRTALLLGVIAFLNTQQAQAQPVSITPEMPDAFETMTPTVDDGEYYFIQFYNELNDSPYLYQPFLGELGEGEWMQAMDYMPFAANRQWTLVAGSAANQYKLKSKRGFYVYLASDNNRFRTTANADNATEFELIQRGNYRTGFYQLRTISGVSMGRWAGGEWGNMMNVGNSNVAYFRFAKLKPNAAHIIYYREGGADNSDPLASTIRHYLT